MLPIQSHVVPVPRALLETGARVLAGDVVPKSPLRVAREEFERAREARRAAAEGQDHDQDYEDHDIDV